MYRARRVWKDQEGRQEVGAHKERACLDPREIKVCQAKLVPLEKEGLEIPELRVSQDQRDCQVFQVCQGRMELLGRRVSQELQVYGDQKGHLELAPKVKRVTKVREE